MKMDLEEFIDIKDYEGLYKINRKGEVLIVKSNKIKKPQLSNKGYYRICLNKDCKKKNFLIHRLVAIHFIPNHDNHPVIDHIDRNKTNNNINNLRWCSYSDNSKNVKIKGCICKQISKKKKKDYIYYIVSVRRKHIKHFKTYEEAEIFLKKYLEENEK